MFCLPGRARIIRERRADYQKLFQVILEKLLCITEMGAAGQAARQDHWETEQ